ncbi:MAG: hypothetical protein MJ079_04450 [Ruminococcus sp.]|nr:hypothetical protein [Ruminococcus sp.]
MTIFELNRNGYRSEQRNAEIRNGTMTLETLTPLVTDERAVLSAEKVLDGILSRFREQQEETV